MRRIHQRGAVYVHVRALSLANKVLTSCEFPFYDSFMVGDVASDRRIFDCVNL